MQTVYYNRQIALTLNDSGIILKVLTNSFQDIDLKKGNMFVSIIDPENYSIYFDYFSELPKNETPLSFQVKLANQSSVYVFLAKVENEISLFAFEIEKDAESIFNQIIEINNMHINSIRALNKKLEGNAESKELFEEMMKLNSVLINNRRELSIKNIELEKLNEKLDKVNLTDYLTKIYNRRKFFIDIYDGVLKNNLLLIMMDFNNFKIINDQFGHKRGDETLVFFANEMTKNIEQFSGNLYRLGGDEFAILMKEDSKVNLTELFNSLDQKLKDFHKDVSIAFGSVVVTKDNCNSDIPAEESMKKADAQMYLKKTAQKT